ncbi:MAG: AIM24 family protein [Roseibacillus sp.]|nr:AIM24 family protein [Roseibacillus sp.]
MQIVEIELDPGETVIAEAGAMNYMEEDITFEAKMRDGMCFIHAGGTLIKRELKGETLRVDTGCLVAFTDGVTYDIQRAGNLKSMFFGGEGLFLATLQGQGSVWLQSLPFSRLADRVMANVGSRGKGEGSILGGIGNLLDGD